MSFFEKRPNSPQGRFFADQPGKETGEFHKKAAAAAMGPGETPPGAGSSSSSNVSPTAMATAGSAAPNQGQAASAGELYGTGAGCGANATATPPQPTKPAAGVTDGAKKVAGTSPTDWDFVFPTGFHRPTAEQPEALEAGEERFHSTEAPGVDYGTGKGIRQGGTADGNFMASLLGGSQMGKHADDPGVTSGQFWKNRASEAGNSIRSGANELGDAASSAISSATSSPLLMTLGAGLLARKGLKAGAGAIKKVKAGRAAARLGHAGEVASAAKKGTSLAQKVSEGAQKVQRFLRR